MIETLAGLLKGAAGASRAVVDGGRLLGVEPVFGGTINVSTGFTGDGTAIFLVRPKSFAAESAGGGAAAVGSLEVAVASAQPSRTS